MGVATHDGTSSARGHRGMPGWETTGISLAGLGAAGAGVKFVPKLWRSLFGAKQGV